MEKKEKEIYVVLWTTSHDTDMDDVPAVDDGVILCHTKDEAVSKLKELYSSSLKQVVKPHGYKYSDANSYYVESKDKKRWERAQIIVGYV
jgi:hypothetical protein